MSQDQNTSPTPQPDSASETGPDVPPAIQPEAELQEAQLAAEQDIQSIIESLQSWFANAVETLLSASTLWQAFAILAAVGLGWVASRRPSHYMKAKRDSRDGTDILYQIYNALAGVMWPVCVVVLLWVAMFAFRNAEQPAGILRIVASLTNAAIIVRLLTRNMEEGPLRTLIAVTAWGAAALYILEWLDPLTTALDGAALTIGGARISVLQVISSFVLAIAALWLGRIAGDAVQSQLKSSKKLTPSMSGLLGQVAKIGLMILAVYIALTSVGIDMAAFAVLGGAIGVGIGFGLQSIFSNFISGIIILFEKSIKVGDFIELQSGVHGQVGEINIRSTLVTTNDSVDILVPNEEFIKAQVINWTLRDPRRRLRVSFGVAYGTEKETVKKAGLEAAAAVEWTDNSEGHDPAVWLVEFGDSSLNYELVVWLIDEAVKRPGLVIADYNWAIHSALAKYKLEIPFPQRDINIRQPAEITVRMAKGASGSKSDKPS
ncbi:MAG: mechanosensitive ion channel family protein [Litorimonas sp.]